MKHTKRRTDKIITIRLTNRKAEKERKKKKITQNNSLTCGEKI